MSCDGSSFCCYPCSQALAEQIKSHHKQIRDISNKSRQVVDQCEMLGPMVLQKLDALKESDEHPSKSCIKPTIALSGPKRSQRMDRKQYERNINDSGVFLSPGSSFGTNSSIAEDSSVQSTETKPSETAAASKQDGQSFGRRVFKQVDSRDNLTDRLKDLVNSLETSADFSEANEASGLSELSLEILEEPSSPRDWMPFSPQLSRVHWTDPVSPNAQFRKLSRSSSNSSSTQSPRSRSISPLASQKFFPREQPRNPHLSLGSQRSSTRGRSLSPRPLYTPPLMRSISPLFRPSASLVTICCDHVWVGFEVCTHGELDC